jgi:hypothetical protein
MCRALVRVCLIVRGQAQQPVAASHADVTSGGASASTV